MYLSPLTYKIYLLVNLFSKLPFTFILQWIAFIVGRDKEKTNGPVGCKTTLTFFVMYCYVSPEVEILCRP